MGDEKTLMGATIRRVENGFMIANDPDISGRRHEYAEFWVATSVGDLARLVVMLFGNEEEWSEVDKQILRILQGGDAAALVDDEGKGAGY